MSIDDFATPNGNVIITKDAIRFLLLKTRDDIRKSVIGRNELMDLLGFTDRNLFARHLKSKECKIEKAIAPKTYKLNSVKAEIKRLGLD